MGRPDVTGVSLSGSVLTHPARGDVASRVVSQAPAGLLRVVTDPLPSGPPTVIRTALAAWESIPASSTHHLIVQDDMLLSGTLFERAQLAIEAMPAAALALFSLWDSRNSGAVRLGALSGARWVGTLNEYTPCAALILPRAVAAGYVDYVRRRPWTWPEDILMSRYLRSRNVPCRVGVPNLAEHEDIPSIAGNGFRGPRRSVCFVPLDRPAREDNALTEFSVVPFFKNAVAQCVVRLDGAAPTRWLHLQTADYLRGAGVASRDLTPRLGRLTVNLDHRAVTGTWLTAYVLGMQTRRRDHQVDPLVAAEALRTIAVGGMSHTAPAPQISEAHHQLAQVAVFGVEAGRDAAPRPRHRGPTIHVLGAEGPLGEHFVRVLADRGHPVTVVTSAPPDSTQRGIRYLITKTPPTGNHAVVVDLRPLRSAESTATAPTITIRPGGQKRSTIRCDAGDLYGPGCGPGSLIGAMVWAALQSKPIVIEDTAPDVVRPRHVSELVDLVLAGLGERTDPPLPQYPIREFAQIVTLVRPTPVHDLRTTAPPPSCVAESRPQDGNLRFRLHHFSQWLAYEYAGTDPAIMT